MSDTATPRRQKGRSPGYPAINLETAVERVRVLWQAEQHHPTPVAAVVNDWGYKSLNGPAGLSLAALKKFGLTDGEGSGDARRIRVSDLALRILEHPEPDVRHAALQEAALNPNIHQAMWEKFGPVPPSDSTVRWWLTQDRGFTQTGADGFMPEYRATIAFAQLTSDVNVGAQGNQVQSEDGLNENTRDARGHADHAKVYKDPAHSSKDPSVTTIPVLLPSGEKVTIEGRFPITEADWNQMMAVLNVTKLGMVKEDAPERFKPDEGPLTLP
jgi:hypothetical protein